MTTKNDAEVVINGRVYTLCSYESPDYLHKIATYINNKQSELKDIEGYNRLDMDMKNILLNINIADDYYKAKKQAEELEDNNSGKDNEIFELKHEIVVDKSKLNEAEKELEKLKKEINENQKKIIKLETELENAKSKQNQSDSTYNKYKNNTQKSSSQHNKQGVVDNNV